AGRCSWLPLRPCRRSPPRAPSEIDAARALDQERVKRLAARNQARQPRRRTVVVMRVAAMVGDDAAGFFGQERRRGKIPLTLVRERDGGVGAARSDKGKTVGDRVHPFGLHLGPRLLPDLLLEEAAAGDEQRAFERAFVARGDRLVVEEGALAA